MHVTPRLHPRATSVDRRPAQQAPVRAARNTVASVRSCAREGAQMRNATRTQRAQCTRSARVPHGSSWEGRVRAQPTHAHSASTSRARRRPRPHAHLLRARHGHSCIRELAHARERNVTRTQRAQMHQKRACAAWQLVGGACSSAANARSLCIHAMHQGPAVVRGSYF